MPTPAPSPRRPTEHRSGVSPAPRDAEHTRHPVDHDEESAAGEEDPGAGLDVITPPEPDVSPRP